MKQFATILLITSFNFLIAQTNSIHNSPPLKETAPESTGMSSERLSRIDDMIRTSIADNNIPGAVALVARNGKIVYHKAFGKADNTSGRDLKKDHIFRIASQTKAITSTAVMMLWEEGRFRLNEPISNYIPEFKEMTVLDTVYEDGTYETIKAEKPITIRHLLTHTSGLGYGVIDGNETIKKLYKEAGVTDLFTTEEITIEESVKKLAKLPLHHEPGERFTYSEGLDVLGYFIEIVSGQTFDEFLRTRIFEPLGMDDTYFYLPEDKYSRMVTIQKFEDGKWMDYPTTFYDPNYPIKGAKRFFSGGAGLSSTAKDYATFLQMYLNNGELNGKRLLSRTTVQFIMENQIGDLWGDSGAYHGLAFGVVDDMGEGQGGRGSEGTFNWGGYFNTQYFADPKEKIVAVLLKQTRGNTGDSTGWKFPVLVMQAVDD